MLDDSTGHNLILMPTFSGNARSSELKSTVLVVGGHVTQNVGVPVSDQLTILDGFNILP